MFSPYEMAEKIKYLAEQKNISVKTVLEECELNPGIIYDMQKRNRVLSSEILNILADYFGVSADYILGRTDYPYLVEKDYVVDNELVTVGFAATSPSDDQVELTQEDIEAIKNLIARHKKEPQS